LTLAGVQKKCLKKIEVNAFRFFIQFQGFLKEIFFEKCKKSSLASEEVKEECNKILDQKLQSGVGFEPFLD
jgi:hypothetical protein